MALTPPLQPMREPDELLEALDPEQRAVAQQVCGPLCVLAGAGTGKTRAITYRIAYASAVGAIDPRNVMAVTYTHRAGVELRERLAQLGVPQVQARTFHAAAMHQLRYFWPAVIGGSMPPVATRTYDLVRTAAQHSGITVTPTVVRDLAAEIAWTQVMMCEPEHYPEEAARLGRTPPGDTDFSTVATLIDAYEEEKKRAEVIDFNDTLILMVAMMSRYEDVARQVRSLYRSFIVDEFQDVSPLQFALLNQWVGQRHDVCVVGDVAQTIYSFAGAHPRYLRSFADWQPGARCVELNRNYRSTPQIVSVANAVMHRPWRRGDSTVDGVVQLHAQRPSGEAVRFDSYATDEDEANGVAQRILDLHRRGVAWEDVAVIFRTNAQSPIFEEALTQHGIPFAVRGGERYFERGEIVRAMVILERMVNQGADINPDYDADDLVTTVRNVAREGGWRPQPPSGRGAERGVWDSLNALITLAGEHRDLTLRDFVAVLKERRQAQYAPRGCGVTLCTMHSAKGLEWDAVFVTGCAEKLLPLSHATTNDDIDEEKRLLYVGLTRARSYLAVSYAKARGAGRSGAANQLSRFLEGVWPGEDEDNAEHDFRQWGRGTRGVRGAQPPRRFDIDEALADSPVEVRELYDDLKEWRIERSRARGCPAYTVMSNRSLFEIASLKPTSAEELLSIHGIGAKTVDDYGQEILAITTAR